MASSILVGVCFIFLNVFQGTIKNDILLDITNLNGYQVLTGQYPALLENDFTGELRLLGYCFVIGLILSAILLLITKFSRPVIILNLISTLLFIWFLVQFSNLETIYAENARLKFTEIHFTFDLHFNSLFSIITGAHWFISIANLILLVYESFRKNKSYLQPAT